MSDDRQSEKKTLYVFHLYITGMNSRSLAAIQNLKKICEEYLKGQYEMKVVDLALNPESASHNQIIATPTLVKSLPLPVRTLIGDLSNTHQVLINLEIKKD